VWLCLCFIALNPKTYSLMQCCISTVLISFVDVYILVLWTSYQLRQAYLLFLHIYRVITTWDPLSIILMSRLVKNVRQKKYQSSLRKVWLFWWNDLEYLRCNSNWSFKNVERYAPVCLFWVPKGRGGYRGVHLEGSPSKNLRK